MNPNVWNIKDILSIPSGNRSGSGLTSGHASLTDSQFVCGSQFWPENSQSLSQDMSFSCRTSQQNSQEGNEPKIFSSYNTKPFLFGGEGRDKTAQNVQKAINILDKFEEDKKKAKEKMESDLSAKEYIYFKETLKNIKDSINDTEKNTAACKMILEGFDHFATTLQKNLSSLHDSIGQQFEIMLNKVSSHETVLSKMEDNVAKTGGASTELCSQVQGLQQNLGTLKHEQGREQNMLQEALTLLNTLVSKFSTKPSNQVCDSSVQTSPQLFQPLSSLQKNSQTQNSQVTLCQPENSQATFCQPEISQVTFCELENSQVVLPSSDPGGSFVEVENSYVPKGRIRNRRRPLVLPRRSTGRVRDENTKPLIRDIKQEDMSPVKQPSSPDRVASPKPNTWIRHRRETTSNSSTGEYITPFAMWSQDSSSSVFTIGTEPSTQKLLPGQKSELREKTRGFWQLFDITSDSDPFPVEEE